MYVSAGVGGVAAVLPALEPRIQSHYFLDQPCISGGSVHTIKKIADALVVTTKENDLEVNGEETKYVIMSEDLNPGRRATEQCKYLGTTLKNQNSLQNEIYSRLKSGNACYHSVQNFFIFPFATQKYIA
jgi:hypothetical protein